MGRLILAELSKLLAPVLLVYGVLLAVSFWCYPPMAPASLDTRDAQQSFLGSDPAYLAFSGSALAQPGPTLVVMGASNAQMGFRPNQLAAQLPGVQVHNLGLGGCNVDGLRAAVELVYANRTPEQRGDLILVLGLWYGMFTHLESNPDQAPLTLQLRRFGFYQPKGEGFERLLSPGQFDMAVNVVRPFFLLQSGLRAHGPLDNFLRGSPGDPGSAPTSAPMADSRDFALPSAQFEALVALSQRVKQMGGHLILADLPQPAAFTAVSPLWRRYQEAKTAYFARAQAHGATIIDMQFMNADGDFGDGTHPKPEAAARWAEELADQIRRRVRSGAEASRP